MNTKFFSNFQSGWSVFSYKGEGEDTPEVFRWAFDDSGRRGKNLLNYLENSGKPVEK